MKIKKSHLFRSTALFMTLLLLVQLLAAPASAATGQNVKITTYGQTVDTFNGVPAKYIPGVGNSDSGTYSCANYVKEYYKKIFGVTVSNLLSNCTPVVSESGYTFKTISSGVRPGDVVRLPGHWAIVKAVNGANLTLIEQNWKWLYKGVTYATINRVVTLGSTSGLAVFRLYKNGQDMNGGSAPAPTVTNGSRGYVSASTSLEDLLFDYKLYADLNNDLKLVFGYNEAALRVHWKTCGQAEGRVASVFFDAKWYLKNNPDVARAYGSANYQMAYNHFLAFGFNEGRQGSPIFSAKTYLGLYPDLRAAYGSNYLAAARHYRLYGMYELRKASAYFSVDVYSAGNPDVARAFSDPLDRIAHYIRYCQYGSERRTCV